MYKNIVLIKENELIRIRFESYKYLTYIYKCVLYMQEI